MSRIKKILFSQHRPSDFEKSSYANYFKNYHVEVDFYKFFKVDEIPLSRFLSYGISISDHTAIIFTSKNAIDYLFRIINELKITLPDTMKYFCSNEGTANYLLKYLVSYKRKTFFPKDGSPEKLIEKITLNASEKFLLPMAMDSSVNQFIELLNENKINYTKAEIFKISFPKMPSAIDIYSYNMIVFFSPYGIQNLMYNYPDFKQNNMIIATFGSLTLMAAQEAGLNVQISAPTPKDSSIFSALERYLKKTNRIK